MLSHCVPSALGLSMPEPFPRKTLRKVVSADAQQTANTVRPSLPSLLISGYRRVVGDQRGRWGSSHASLPPTKLGQEGEVSRWQVLETMDMESHHQGPLYNAWLVFTRMEAVTSCQPPPPGRAGERDTPEDTGQQPCGSPCWRGQGKRASISHTGSLSSLPPIHPEPHPVALLPATKEEPSS